MKEINDKEASSTLCDDTSATANDVCSEIPVHKNEDEKVDNADNADNLTEATVESTLLPVTDCVSVPTIADETGPSDGQVTNDLKVDVEVPEPVDVVDNKEHQPNLNTTISSDETVIGKDRKLGLRPRKVDSSTEKPANAKKSKSTSKKLDRKSAIFKSNISNISKQLLCEPPILISMNDNSIKANDGMLPPDLPLEASPDASSSSSSQVLFQNVNSTSLNIANCTQRDMPMLSSEMEIVVNDNIVRVKPNFDENSLKMKENSGSDTRISSTSENSNHIKIIKRRKRRKELWKKKKRRSNVVPKVNGNDLLIGGAFHFARNGNTSLSMSEISNNKKRKCSDSSDNSHKKSREFVVPSPSLADINVKAAIPESTATSLEMSRTGYCLCRKKANVFISGNNNTGDLYCQGLDCIDTRVVGCCNPIPSQDVGLLRASQKTPYQMLCSVHQQRLLRHNCCPGCGLFCTQGKYLMCKSMHHFHKACCVEYENELIICPHCGDDTPPKTVSISVHGAKDPVFLPQQKPPRTLQSAKICITRNMKQAIEDDIDSLLNFPTSILNLPSGDQLIAGGLPQSLNRDKYTVKNLYNAAHSGDVEKLLRMMASGLNPNHVFEEFGRQTALHVAAANGHLPAVHILLQAQAQINASDAEQNTALSVAITSGHNDVVKYLVKCGADLLAKGEDGMSPLHIAAKSGNVGACFHILNSTKLPPKYIDSLDDGGWTPMVWASEFNHIEVVKFLMSKGADSLIRDAEQNIALHWAAFGGSIDIVELYLNHGSDINAVNVHGDTPLHIAARQDKYNCVLLLLARGSRSDIKNKAGELPRNCAESPESEIYKGITLNMEISALLTKFQERTPRIISNDISRGKERNQIQCVNVVDDEDEPRDYMYVSESCFTSKITVDRTITSLQYCKCGDNCNHMACNCATISIQCWYDHEGRLRPDFNYADPPMIFECNQACQCNRITCQNRVVQNGISCRFQLFRTTGKGWGIKTLNLIPKGTYVCEYIGEIISDCEADHREDDSYLFDLDNRDGETYCIDARRYGNFARFINHMCVPNLMPVHVFVEHQDIRFPRIAFFANRDILPEEELGYNYGEKFWVIKWKSFTCTCGAEKCIYSEKTIKNTLDNYNRKLLEENL